MNIAETIKKERKMSGLSQEELAELSGVSIKTLQRWEWGQRVPRADELDRLAFALGTNVADLIGGTDTFTSSSNPLTFTPVQKEAITMPQAKSENRGILSYTFKNGEKLEVPNMPETAPQFWARVDRLIGLQPAASPA